MSAMHVTLNNGVEMPALGFGVFQTPPDETRAAVSSALEAGYRHVDTAAAYGNERRWARPSPPADLDAVFLETKIWISDYGYEETLHGFDKSARKLGVDRIDLLILHQALPSEFDKTLAAYRALEKLYADGKVRAIGVSNFMVEHLTALLDSATVVPAVNQIEVHPYFQQREVQAFGAAHGILTQAWSPIGGITFYRESGHTSTLEDPVIGEIAQAHGKTPAQVMLRWHLQQGRSAIPKSVRPQRIAENFDVFDFELTGEQLAAIDGLDTGKRGGPEPADITLAAFGRPIPETLTEDQSCVPRSSATSRSPASASARWACPTATPAPAATTPNRSAPSTAPSTWASPSSTPRRSTARTSTRNSSAGRSRAAATRSCWPPSSVWSRTTAAARGIATAARTTSASPSRAR